MDETFDDLKARGIVADVTRPVHLERDFFENKQQVVYMGIDPTARSLHVGHLVPLLCLLHFQLRGHKTIPLIGGATGLIGDPSGRSTERPLSSPKTIEDNVAHLTKGINTFFERAIKYGKKRYKPTATIIPPDIQNNMTWLKDLSLLEFLRTVGFHSRVNWMLSRESVQERLQSQQGISFTEFTYQLLQAYDFYYLHTHMGCTVQVGGSDQWGNIIAGIELISRANAAPGSKEIIERGYGITTPLLTTPSGQKFGKSAGNAVSLNEEETSVFDFYQFFLRSSDAVVGGYLNLFTLLSREWIEGLMAEHKQHPGDRDAQQVLAAEVTELVHGEEGVRRAKLATAVVYDQYIHTWKAEDVLPALDGNPFLHLCDPSQVIGVPLTKLAAKFSVVASISAARRLVSGKGLYLNNVPVTDVNQKLTAADLIDERLALLRAGSHKVAVIALQ